jgi:hypothetical protein
MTHDGTYSSLVGIAHDHTKGLYWTFTKYAVYKYKVVDKARNVWRVYLEKGQFELATRHCSQEPDALDQILTKQADHLFNWCQFVECLEQLPGAKMACRDMEWSCIKPPS